MVYVSMGEEKAREEKFWGTTVVKWLTHLLTMAVV